MLTANTTTGREEEATLGLLLTTDGILLADEFKIAEALRIGTAMRIGDIIVGLIPSLESPA